MNVALEQFKNINSGMTVTVYIDENNGMYYAKSGDALYFTRHYEKKKELYGRLKTDGFCLYDENMIAHGIKRYNNLMCVEKNGEVYQMEQELQAKFLRGDKKIIAEMIEKFTANREANIEPDEDIIEHRCKLCGVNIIEDNLRVCNKCASEYKF